MTDAQKIERLKRALRIIQTWARCDVMSTDTREKYMLDIWLAATRALDEVADSA